MGWDGLASPTEDVMCVIENIFSIFQSHFMILQACQSYWLSTRFSDGRCISAARWSWCRCHVELGRRERSQSTLDVSSDRQSFAARRWPRRQSTPVCVLFLRPTRIGRSVAHHMRRLNTETSRGRSSERGFPLPANPTLSLPLESYVGTYLSPGYPSITLCARSIGIEHDSDYCAAIRSDYSVIDKASNRKPRTAELIARLPRLSFMIDGLRLVHVAEDTFEIVASVLFLQGYGRNTTPFAYGEEEFMAEKPQNSTIPEGIVIFDIGKAAEDSEDNGELTVRGLSLFGATLPRTDPSGLGLLEYSQIGSDV